MAVRIRDAIGGHFWTIAPHLSRAFLERPLHESVLFSTPFTTKEGRKMHAEGWWNQGHVTDTLFVVMHGIGSSPSVPYVLKATRILRKFGCVLRLGLRGSLRAQGDFYHGGLTEDLRAALSSPMCSRYQNIFLVGFSLGGHVALRYCTEVHDGRVRGVVAICPPLDLASGQRRIDQWSMTIYRNRILDGLRQIYAQCAPVARERGWPLPANMNRLNKVKTIREWDSETVVPRFGFDSADHYYESASVSSRLRMLRIPALILAARHDPLIPFKDVESGLIGAPSNIEMRVLDNAGHVGFRPGTSIGESGPAGVFEQIASWCQTRIKS